MNIDHNSETLGYRGARYIQVELRPLAGRHRLAGTVNEDAVQQGSRPQVMRRQCDVAAGAGPQWVEVELIEHEQAQIRRGQLDPGLRLPHVLGLALVDLWDRKMEVVEIERNPNCPVCGE